MNRLPPWLQITAEGVTLVLHVQPGARRTEVVGPHGDALKLRLASPPVDGKANAELLRFIAAQAGVGRGAVSLLSGESSRQKRVLVRGGEADRLLVWAALTAQ